MHELRLAVDARHARAGRSGLSRRRFAGEQVARVHDPGGIERAAQRAHQIDAQAQLGAQTGSFASTDAVVMRQRPARAGTRGKGIGDRGA